MDADVQGTQLIEYLIQMTGLPATSVRMEMTRLLEAADIDPNSATLSDLRDILADYLQDALLEAKRDGKKQF